MFDPRCKAARGPEPRKAQRTTASKPPVTHESQPTPQPRTGPRPLLELGRGRANANRGEQGMGFSHEKTTHHLDLLRLR
jgi:hypothetical protein